MIFVISGPSGCGKSTLVQAMLNEVDSLEFSVSHTTRPKRKGETEAKDYYFVSRQEFNQMIRGQKMVEWAEVFGHRYGTSQLELERKSSLVDLILDIDIQGARQIREKVRRAVSVFVFPPAFPELKKRLLKRGLNSEEEIRVRLEAARKEIRAYPDFDYIIINSDLDKAAEELKSIIVSQRCRLEPRKKEIIPILRSFSEELSE